MRKVVVTNIVSLDGYAAGPGGDVMALPMDHAFDEHNAERMRVADTLLLGATTYRGFVSFWPNALQMPDLTAPSREIAERYAAGIEIVAVSDTLTQDDTGPWRDQTRIVRRADAATSVGRLREGDGGDVLVFGSPTLWGYLLTAGLVDELHLMVAPTVLSDGLRAFSGPASLDLVSTRRWDGSDNVLLSYAARDHAD
jgi:dihydrofolate reductase